MLTKLYVDNYKSLVNFDLNFERQHLLMGPNGSGKSTVFEVLQQLTAFLTLNLSADEAFGRRTLTRWQTHPIQQFGLEFSTPHQGTFTYELAVRHPTDQSETIVEREVVLHNGQRLFELQQGKVTLHANAQSWGPFPLRLPKSFLSLYPPVPELTHFRDAANRVLTVRIDPRGMEARAPHESTWLSPDLRNFASWYRAVGTQTGAFQDAFQRLGEALPGFRRLELMPNEDGRRLVTVWKDETGEAKYDFSELSDGQRALIGLYALAHWWGEKGGTLCLDEPDNFLALTEVQPLLSLLDAVENVQTLVISHHPEVINGLARDHGLRFDRKFNGPTRVTAFNAPPDTLLTPAELVARGEDNESP